MEELIVRLVTQFGAVGVLVWLVFHVFKVLIPDALNRIALELDTQRREFRAILDEQNRALQQIVLILKELERSIQEVNRSRHHASRNDS